MNDKYTAYKLKYRYGVDDLVSSNPYTGEWSHFSPFFKITEEEYKADVKGYEDKANAYNTTYLNKLKEEGRYKEEYEITFNMMNLPEFDNPTKEPQYSNFGMLIPKGDVGNIPKFDFKYEDNT
jgi:hypothetical protein